VILDVNATMQKHLGGAEGDGQARFQVAIDSIKMLIEQKVSERDFAAA
jgi:hypothetical protein